MDCLSEEQMIRMKLGGLETICLLKFDIPNRLLEVYHTDNYDKIFQRLGSLNFDTTVLSTEIVKGIDTTDNIEKEKKLLWQVLFINFFFFLLEILTGIIANSMGLVADSLDMLADSIVYGLALFAVGGSVTRKRNIAQTGGYFQMILAILGCLEIFRRFLGFGEVPNFQTMIVISFWALIGNSLCLYLLQKSKSREAHMRASMIFTSNDVIVNIGVIAAGGLVYFTHSKLPDLVIGIIVFILVGRGAYRILKL